MVYRVRMIVVKSDIRERGGEGLTWPEADDSTFFFTHFVPRSTTFTIHRLDEGPNSVQHHLKACASLLLGNNAEEDISSKVQI